MSPSASFQRLTVPNSVRRPYDVQPVSDETVARTWRVTATLLVPTWIESAPGGGPPAKLEPKSRLPEQAAIYDGVPMVVRTHQYPGSADSYPVEPGHTLMELVSEVVAGEEPTSAVRALEVPVTTLLDLLSFQMGAAIGIEQMNAIDVTTPVAVGDSRTFHFWGGSPFGQFQRGVDMEAVRGQLLGEFPPSLGIEDERVAAALRWFVKALSTQFLHDQYLFLWIALEILCDATAFKVEEPSRCPRCGHETPECPSCGRPTTQRRQGQTMQGFIEQFGVSKADSSEMWKCRQIMHGRAQFQPGTGEEIGRLVQLLRAVVAAGLKSQLGLGTGNPPLVSASGLSIHPSLSLGGTSLITEDQLRPLVDA